MLLTAFFIYVLDVLVVVNLLWQKQNLKRKLRKSSCRSIKHLEMLKQGRSTTPRLFCLNHVCYPPGKWMFRRRFVFLLGWRNLADAMPVRKSGSVSDTTRFQDVWNQNILGFGICDASFQVLFETTFFRLQPKRELRSWFGIFELRFIYQS